MSRVPVHVPVRIAVGIAGFVSMCLVSATVLGQPGRPPSEVEVVNTPDVNVVNTPDVNIANTPSVDVNSLPAVQVAPGAVVRDRDNPALQPVQFTCEVVLGDGEQIDGTTCVDAASLGSRTLVIEQINATVGVPTGQRPFMRISVSAPDPLGASLGIERNYYFETCGTFSGFTDCHWIDRQVRLYHTAFNVVVSFGRSSPWTGGVTFRVHLGGYLVDD